MSNMCLVMVIIFVMGRNHFFAIYFVVNNVMLGVVLIGWGLLIDAVGTRFLIWLGFAWNRFMIFFAAVVCVYLVMLVLVWWLDEFEAVSMEELLCEILIQSPQ